MSFSLLRFSCLTLVLVLAVACAGNDAQMNAITTPMPPQERVYIPAPAQQRPAYAPLYSSQQAVQQETLAPYQPTVQPAAQNVKVALLVPLSGPHAPLGDAMVKAAEMAVFDIGVNNFELMPRDTKGTPSGTIAAAKSAIDSGAQLFIGPVFAADVAAAKPIAQKAGVNMLALSTDVSLAQPGLYVLGFAPAPQAERMASYAFDQGKTRFAMITPQGAYGKLVAQTFRNAVQTRGGQIVVESTPDNLAPIVAAQNNLDALFLPLGGAQLKSVLSNLVQADFNVARVKLLGTGLWDEAQIVQENPALLGAWFPAAEPASRAAFLKSYESTYGAAPLRLATLAYDATALAAVLTYHGLPLNRDTLIMPTGFAGVDGLFRLQPSGTIERGLAVMEVSSPENIAIDPAPTSFASPD